MAKGDKKPFHEEFAEKVTQMLEEGTAPWQKPWHPAENLAPRNPISGTSYRGVNYVNLLMTSMREGYDDPRWMTLKQANEAGYKIKAGSHSTSIAFYRFTKEIDQKDEEGKPILDEKGEPKKEKVPLERPILSFARVFNARQVENFPALPPSDKQFAWDPHEKAEKILENSNARIFHDQPDRAFYSVLSDEIHLPPKDAFDLADKYYATALHELGHWTGAPHRLNRTSGAPFGKKSYAKEELRAEISSWMVGQDIGIGHDPGQHAAYVKSWIEVLKNDPMEIMRACRDAEKIRDYVMGLEMGKEKDIEQEHAITEEKQQAAMGVPDGTQLQNKATEKTWLAVPYREKNAAKALGARWDGKQKQWYAPEGVDLAPLRKWLSAPEKRMPPQECLDPQHEFARKLEDLGLDLKGQLPEMDGKTHRVPLLSKNGRGLDGAYRLHGDGIPAGWAQNHVTGEKIKLVASGVMLSPAERERQKAEHAARREQAERERAQARDAAAERCRGLWDSFEPAAPDHPYLEKKGIEAFGLRQNQGSLIVPLRNVDGDLRGIQAIGPDGQKSFASGMEKKGNFHLLGGEDKDLSSGEIILCEGYATGASLRMATGKPIAVAFDSGNLLPVAEALRVRHPNAAITICADNDHSVKRDGKPYNPGLEKAKLAALAVNAKVIVPAFTREEKAKGLTDFNDLHQSRGLDAVKKQLGIREQSKELFK